ncbi:unnamed protein product, partial [Allacma fusca]
CKVQHSKQLLISGLLAATN